MIQVALLRAINLAGHQPVAMADLRSLLTELGLRDPQSALQSGNLVFEAGKQTGASLERLIEHELARQLDLRTDVMVRSAAEWASVVARNPFRNEAARDPARLVVVFLKSKPTADAFDALRKTLVGPEILHGEGLAGLHRLSRRYRTLAAHGGAHRTQACHPRHGAQLEHRNEARCAGGKPGIVVWTSAPAASA
ncbi:MAG: DUF1697 domain-containing protein [Xanthobacteraceae bacterium]